jgi:Rrf2 family protein
VPEQWSRPSSCCVALVADLPVRISAKSDYAVRAMTELAVGGEGAVKADQIAAAQDIPLNFLLGILRELRNSHLVRSQRGRDGGYALARPAREIALADVIRAVDGPLANVRDMSLAQLSYPGAAAPLRDVWLAVRGSLREVLENVTIDDLATGQLPRHVRQLALRHQAERP